MKLALFSSRAGRAAAVRLLGSSVGKSGQSERATRRPFGSNATFCAYIRGRLARRTTPVSSGRLLISQEWFPAEHTDGKPRHYSKNSNITHNRKYRGLRQDMAKIGIRTTAQGNLISLCAGRALSRNPLFAPSRPPSVKKFPHSPPQGSRYGASSICPIKFPFPS